MAYFGDDAIIMFHLPLFIAAPIPLAVVFLFLFFSSLLLINILI